MFERKHLTSTDSTHKQAIDFAQSSKKTPLLITADYQESSVGRRPGTSWIAPANTCIIATFFIPDFQSDYKQNLAQLLTCSMTSVCHTLSISPFTKWPNDITLSNKKLGGAMADLQNGCAIISCALNVNTTAKDLEKIDIPATSLAVETNKTYDIESLTLKLQDIFTKDYSTLQTSGFAPFAKIMNQSLMFQEERVTIEESLIEEGVVKEIADDGRLVVESDGETHLLSKGSLHSNY